MGTAINSSASSPSAKPSSSTSAGASVSYALDMVHVAKSFQRKTVGRRGYSSLKSFFLGLNPFAAKVEANVSITHAIKDLTLRIPRGSSVGLIGRNGSGKSTFLKLVTGIYRPDTGSISVKGRIAALIELGAGFHPDFSGRENLFLSGIMLGLTRREVEERFDAIVDFAELRHVIDDPLRTYSSGMFMRLGFSIAVHTDPDVLLVDEVLSVGDLGFVTKCKERINELRRRGITLVLVSHDLDSVERWCDEVLWLHGGEVRDRGEPRRVIDHYREFLEKGEEEALEKKSAAEVQEIAPPSAASAVSLVDPAAVSTAPERWGSREIEITKIYLRNSAGEEHHVFHPDDALMLEAHYTVNEPVRDAVFGIGINRVDGLIIFGSNTEIERITLPDLKQSGVVRYQISRLGLLAGSYSLDLAVHRSDGYPYDYHKRAVPFVVRSHRAQVGVYVPPHHWEVQPL